MHGLRFYEDSEAPKDEFKILDEDEVKLIILHSNYNKKNYDDELFFTTVVSRQSQAIYT